MTMETVTALECDPDKPLLTLAGAFECYAQAHIPVEKADARRAGTERAFYAGAAVILTAIDETLNGSVGEFRFALDQLQ